MLYIVYMDLYGKGYTGVRKKVLAQIRAFSRSFEKVFYTIYSGQMMHLLLDDTILEKELALTWQECHRVVMKWILKYDISKTYIRCGSADRWFVQFLKEQKERRIVSILEFPTVPYDGELSNKRIITEDLYYREKMVNYADRCTAYADFDDVFGIPCIPLFNGIDIEEHPVRPSRKKDGNIVLLAVAYMAKWHGYERVIEGMAQYYMENDRKNIRLKLVGEGPELARYKSLVRKYGLEAQVEFCGELVGEELNRQYAESDIALGSLGLYKKGIERGAPIKLREYCSRGIPFIYGYEDTGFKGNEVFLMHVSNNSEIINMQAVIAFYEKISKDFEIRAKMRETALQRFTWDTILAPVINYYKSEW